MTSGISPTLLMNETILSKTKNGEVVYALGFGRSPFPVPEILSKSLAEHADHGMYLPSSGYQELRNQIASHHSNYNTIQTHADQVVISPGSKEMIFQIQWALKLPLLLPSPSWVSYGPQAKLLNLGLHWIDTQKSNQYKLTGKALRAYVSSQNIDQSVLILNYPNNPTGVTYTEEELQSIAGVCRKMNITVISDEIYGLLNYKETYNTISKYLPEQTIITSGLSKWCNAGGYRLGYGIFPTQLDDIKRTVISQASETYSCVAAHIQHAAVSVYQNWESILPIIKKQRKVLNFVSTYTVENLNALGVHCSNSEGGFYTFVDFESHRKHIESLGIYTSDNLCQHLLDKWGVALLAGTSFGRDASEYSARLAFVDFDGKAALSKIENYSDYSLFINEVCPKIKESINQIKNFLII